MAEIVGGGTPSMSNEKYWGGDINWYSPAEIGSQIYVTESERKISKSGLKNSSAKILPVGTVLFTSRAGIGNTAILASEATTNQGFQSILPRENELDSYFIFSRTDELKRYGEINGAGSTFVEVSGKQMSQMPLYLPKLPEQSAIGSFFSDLDQLIALHQRKLDDVKTLKKALLQKMFPKNGESFPKIRFPEFTDAWEQRKLGDVVDIYDGVHQTPEYQNSGIMFLSVENIQTLTSDKYISEEAFERDFKVYPQKDDIFMTRIGDIGTTNVVKDNELKAYYVSLALLKHKKEDAYFLSNAIQSDYVQSGLRTRSLLTAIPKKINKDEIGKVDVFCPELPEQEKIGDFFNHLDYLITLHQRKLDDVKMLKKALLQQMFI